MCWFDCGSREPWVAVQKNAQKFKKWKWNSVDATFRGLQCLLQQEKDITRLKKYFPHQIWNYFACILYRWREFLQDIVLNLRLMQQFWLISGHFVSPDRVAEVEGILFGGESIRILWYRCAWQLLPQLGWSTYGQIGEKIWGIYGLKFACYDLIILVICSSRSFEPLLDCLRTSILEWMPPHKEHSRQSALA